MVKKSQNDEKWKIINLIVKIVIWAIPTGLAIFVPQNNQNQIEKLAQDISTIQSTYMTIHFGLRDFDIVKSDLNTIDARLDSMDQKISEQQADVAVAQTELRFIMGDGKYDSQYDKRNN